MIKIRLFVSCFTWNGRSKETDGATPGIRHSTMIYHIIILAIGYSKGLPQLIIKLGALEVGNEPLKTNKTNMHVVVIVNIRRMPD
jgi:hypothetical protein